MSETAEKLKPMLAALTRDERKELVTYLLELNNGNGDEEELTQEEWEAAWAEEINRRIEDSKAGKTVAIPHEEVMRRMKEKYG
jgi:putative addiction module component (TIGR02574 family)